MAIRNSSPALRLSVLVWAIPPNRKNVIRWTGIPRAMATTEWASSWARRETKNSSVMTAAMARRSAGAICG